MATKKPIRVGARRAKDLIIETSDEHQDVKWFEENDIDIPKEHESEYTHNTEP